MSSSGSGFDQRDAQWKRTVALDQFRSQLQKEKQRRQEQHARSKQAAPSADELLARSLQTEEDCRAMQAMTHAEFVADQKATQAEETIALR